MKIQKITLQEALEKARARESYILVVTAKGVLDDLFIPNGNRISIHLSIPPRNTTLHQDYNEIKETKAHYNNCTFYSIPLEVADKMILLWAKYEKEAVQEFWETRLISESKEQVTN